MVSGSTPGRRISFFNLSALEQPSLQVPARRGRHSALRAAEVRGIQNNDKDSNNDTNDNNDSNNDNDSNNNNNNSNNDNSNNTDNNKNDDDDDNNDNSSITTYNKAERRGESKTGGRHRWLPVPHQSIVSGRVYPERWTQESGISPR